MRKSRKRYRILASLVTGVLLGSHWAYAAPVPSGFFEQGDTATSVQWGTHGSMVDKPGATDGTKIETGAYQIGATAWGQQSLAWGQNSTAHGFLTQAIGENTTVWGLHTKASGTGATAWGTSTGASGEYATAWGTNTGASGEYATAWGEHTNASGKSATAWGNSSEASAMYATAWGNMTKATGEYATAWGDGAEASGQRSTAWGKGIAFGEEATAFGWGNATSFRATAWGNYSTASALYATAWGSETKASGKTSTVWGFRSEATQVGSTAWGGYENESGFVSNGGKATGRGSTAWGTESEASGLNSTAWGRKTAASGDGATAWGGYLNPTGTIIKGGTASGLAATAWGAGTTASGDYATAWGSGSIASGKNATAWGEGAIAAGDFATAATAGKAYGKGSFAVGGQTGDENDPTKGTWSIAMGAFSMATVSDAVALGTGSIADRDVATFYNDTANKAYMAGDDTGLAWRATMNAIAVGSDYNTRQIIGVAAGTKDTDAVNVAQLKSAVNYLENKIGQGDVDIEGDKNITVTPPTTDGTDVPETGGTPGTGDTGTAQPGYQIGMKDDVILGGGKEGKDPNAPGSLTVMSQHGNITINKDNDGTVKAGNASIGNNAVKVGDKTYISDAGLNANGQKVTNVADGEISSASKDAVNGSQLYSVQQQISDTSSSVTNLSNTVNRLDGRVNKAVAGAAALASLNPLDFDPEDKLSFAVGYGHYGGEGASAIGAYYQPNEDVRINVGGAFGNGEEMWNAGVSFKLGHGSGMTTSRTAMAREITSLKTENNDLRSRVDQLSRQMEALLSIMDEAKQKDFPDVPANHWAYDAVSKLAGNGVVQGYPDGHFHGERTMTRYEMAEIVYNALKQGGEAETRLVEEFRPELEQIAAKNNQ